MPSESFLIGLDLGQQADPTALAILRRNVVGSQPAGYDCVHLQRYPLGTPYTTVDPRSPGIAQQVKQLLQKPPLPGSLLAVDQTGVGRPVVDIFRTLSLPATLVPVTVTAGRSVTVEDDGSHHVPKADLVACLQVLLQSGRLRVAAGLGLANTLIREFDSFRVKITKAANETFGAWREGEHDDLLFAVALACWAGERFPAFTRDSLGRSPARQTARPPRGETLHGDFRRPSRT